MTKEELKALRKHIKELNKREKEASLQLSIIEQCEYSLETINKTNASESESVRTNIKIGYNHTGCFPYTDKAMYIEAARKGSEDALREAKKRFAEL